MSTSAASWNLVRLAEVQSQPWKNGGGVTRELLAWPSAAEWRLRLSVAEVTQDGPFSRFDGVQRWFAVLGGAGVRLTVDGRSHVLTAASAPFAFDGAADTGCQLVDGPTQDFNLMLRGGSGVLRRVSGRLTGLVDASPFATKIIAAYAISAGSSVDFGNEVMTLEPGTLAWRLVEAVQPFAVSGDATLWMEISP